MIKKRSFKNKNIRKRNIDEPLEQSQEESKTPVQTTTQQEVSKSNLLSFGEEQDKISEIKTVNQEKRIEKHTKKHSGLQIFTSKKKNDTSTIKYTTYFSRSIGEYTPEKLDALRKEGNYIIREETKTTEQTINESNVEMNDVVMENEEKVEEIKIPDRIIIENAKRRRQRAREEQDYIPLSTDKNDDKMDEKSARLIRESDSDSVSNSEDEIFDSYKGNRIKFGKPDEKPKIEIDQEEEEYEEENESLATWEEEQMRKAGIIKEVDEKTAAILENVRKKLGQQRLDKSNDKFLKKGTLVFVSDCFVSCLCKELRLTNNFITEGETAILSFEEIHKQLQNALSNLENEHAEHSKELSRLDEDMKDSEEIIKELNQQLEEENNQYKFYQEMRHYIEDLVDCLDTKVPIIEQNEDELLSLREKEADEKYKNWIEFMKKGINRKRKYESQEPEGWSSDEEEDDQYKKQIQELITKSMNVFKDTREEFSTIGKIKEQFLIWKQRYPKSYTDTYCDLSLQKVFAPFVRLELLSWDPLGKTPFDQQSWFKELLDYGSDELIPELVKQIIVPIVRHTMNKVYNPLSRKQTLNAQALIDDVQTYVDPRSDDMKQIYFAIHERLEKYADDIIIPSFKQNQEFAMRQFWSCIKLMRNVLSWKTKLAKNMLRSIIIEQLYKEKIHPILKEVPLQQRQEMLNQVMLYLPEEWKQTVQKLNQ